MSPRKDEPKLTLQEFRSFMEYVNAECRGIGCGYARRDCRANSMAKWLRTWAGRDRARLLLLPKLRSQFRDKLPDYFRDYSQHDREIESEAAFRRVHQEIAAALTA